MTDKLITQIEEFIVKQQSQPALEYVDTAGQDKASAAASAPKPTGSAAPSGKVPTKIYEMVRRGAVSYTHLTLPTKA